MRRMVFAGLAIAAVMGIGAPRAEARDFFGAREGMNPGQVESVIRGRGGSFSSVDRCVNELPDSWVYIGAAESFTRPDGVWGLRCYRFGKTGLEAVITLESVSTVVYNNMVANMGQIGSLDLESVSSEQTYLAINRAWALNRGGTALTILEVQPKSLVGGSGFQAFNLTTIFRF